MFKHSIKNTNEGMRTVMDDGQLSLYPIDMSSFLIPSLDTIRLISPMEAPEQYTSHALAHWNEYLTTGNEENRKKFLKIVYMLIEHEVHIDNDAGGWPIISSYSPARTNGPWLSALTQGQGLSVLLRAHQLMQEGVFLEVAGRVIRTFTRDILDGGISTIIGEDGIFFEEVAVYPASHMLNGCIFALLGLYEYIALTNDVALEKLIERSLATLHSFLAEFDVGFWTRSDLLQRSLSSRSQLAVQVMLFKALAGYSGCDHCSFLASHWEGYAYGLGTRFLYRISRFRAFITSHSMQWMRNTFFRKRQNAHQMRVCVPITGFPVTGGTRAVLAGLAQTTQDLWQIEYVTQYVAPHTDHYIIHPFGTRRTAPWQFPAVWLYCVAGCRKLIALLHQGADYALILPQDGVFTAAFSAIAAKLVGIRIVCMDHGNLTLLESFTYRTERIQALKTKNWSPIRCLIARIQYIGYWPSLSLLAHISAHLVDYFLIPGVVGDGIEEDCLRLGIPASRLMRFASMIDVNRYGSRDPSSVTAIRRKNNIATDAIVIALVCRLAPEKGIDIALQALKQAFHALPPELYERVRVIIAGDGPLRKHVEATIRAQGLDQTYLLWGETTTTDVISLLSISDIFLYTSTRGACLSMAVLEAMASGCAVVASTLPLSNIHMLAEGRGLSVPPGDVEQTANALLRLLRDMKYCHQMGMLARNYVAIQHSPTMFRRTLMRATYWSGLDTLLNKEMEKVQ